MANKIVPKVTIQIIGFHSSTHEMPKVVVHAVQEHLNGFDVKDFMVRLGEKIDVEKLFTNKKDR